MLMRSFAGLLVGLVLLTTMGPRSSACCPPAAGAPAGACFKPKFDVEVIGRRLDGPPRLSTVTYAVANVFLTLWGPLIVGIIIKMLRNNEHRGYPHVRSQFQAICQAEPVRT